MGKEENRINEERREELKEILQKHIDELRQPGFIRKAPDAAFRKDIREAASGGDRELLALASLYAYLSVLPQLRHMAGHYIDPPHVNEDDLLQSCFAAIQEAMPRYDGEHALTTYLYDICRQELASAWSSGRGHHTTKYYRSIMRKVRQAETELGQKGIHEPSDDQISIYINREFGCSYSPSTILQARINSQAEVNMDALPENGHKDNEPEKAAMQNETVEEVRAMIKQIPLPYRPFLQARLEYEEKHASEPTKQEKLEMVLQADPSLSVKEAAKLIKAAEKACTHYFTRRAALAHAERLRMNVDVQFMPQTTQDILAALNRQSKG